MPLPALAGFGVLVFVRFLRPKNDGPMPMQVPPIPNTYRVERQYRDGRPPEILHTGLSREDALAILRVRPHIWRDDAVPE